MKAQQTKEKPEVVTKLDFNTLRTILQENDPNALKGQKFVMQVLSLKDVEADKNKEGAPEKSEKDKIKAVKFKLVALSSL